MKIPASSGFRLKPEEDPQTGLRSFDILPNRISVNVEREYHDLSLGIKHTNSTAAWRVEAWRRTDDRISYEDILKRMVPDPGYANGAGLELPEANALSNQCRRQCRKPLGNWVDYSRRPDCHQTELLCLERLTHHNVKYNTVLQVCELDPTRIVKLKLVRKTKDENSGLQAVPVIVTPQNIAETTLPIDTFLTEGEKMRGGAEMDWEMERAFELLLTLQERARNHGAAHTDWANHNRLGKACVPETWYDRARNDRTGDGITTEERTYDGGCQVCGWSSPQEKYLLEMVKEDHAVANTANTSPKRTREDAFPKDDPAGDGPKTPQLDYHVCFVEDDDSDAIGYTTDVELPKENSNTPDPVQGKPAKRTAKKLKIEEHGVASSSPPSICSPYGFMPPGMAVQLTTTRSVTPHDPASLDDYNFATPGSTLDAEPTNIFMDITPPLNATKYTSTAFDNHSSRPACWYEASNTFDYDSSINEDYPAYNGENASLSATLPPSPPAESYWGSFRSDAGTLASSIPSVHNTIPESPQANTSTQSPQLNEITDLSSYFDDATMYSTPSVYDGYIPQYDLDPFI